ncbi:hypothetical protein LSH36_920g02022 [Paralvinella palmiformis]|uniref:Uncharacterized protein n=1 Tax=Paralvinella palmiformis TaxID=53620 RepID=A0AAD9MRF6_9ANNE|nr:hypothetical protein LSH36_920g02022 [Paralvinella palmiformis]
MRGVKYVIIIMCSYGLFWCFINVILYGNGQSRDPTINHPVHRRYVGIRHHHDIITSHHEASAVNDISEGRHKAIKGEDRPLLCIFTSLIGNKPHERLIQRAVLENWGSLAPSIRPYLFTDNKTGANWIEAFGLSTWQTIQIRHSRDRLPVFKDMLMTLDDSVNSIFIGYAKDDVLFDASLTETLNYVRQAVKNVDEKQLLLVGRRRNYVITNSDVINVSTVISSSSTLPLAGPGDIDYVIFSRPQFPWDEIPEVVVGASGLINWILALAFEWKYIVIEVTSSVNAVRLTSTDRWHSSTEERTRGNADPNVRLFRREFRDHEKVLERGQTICITYLTICRRWTGDHLKTRRGCNFALAKRRKLPSPCELQNLIKHTEHARKRATPKKAQAPEPYEYDTFEGEMILL